MRTATKNRKGALLAIPLAAATLLVAAAPASAAGEPAWRIDAQANSTAAPGSILDISVEVRNVGSADFDGSTEPISLTGTLPPGLTIQGFADANLHSWDCSELIVGAQTFTCKTGEVFPTIPESPSGYFRHLLIQAEVKPGASGVLTSHFEVSGGDASDANPATPAAATVAPVTITSDPPAFGIAAFDTRTEADAAGTPHTQAAAHPYAYTTFIDFNVFKHPDPLKGDLTPVEAARDIEVDLPPASSPTPAPPRFAPSPSSPTRRSCSQNRSARRPPRSASPTSASAPPTC